MYANPTRRVLFDPVRDANPFFHLIEAMWMLAGERDVALLTQIVSDFDQFAEPGTTLMHGAYGYRWRKHFVFDQLRATIDALRRDRTDRRCVLTMWDPLADWDREKKDLPCNTHAYFRADRGFLDVTVCCRSNDIVWGCYGANVVHMSLMQEYVAQMIGIQVGTYTQISNNWHAYEKILAPIVMGHIRKGRTTDSYDTLMPMISPLVTNRDTFDDELRALLAAPEDRGRKYENLFLQNVVQPMWEIGANWRSADKDDLWDTLHMMPYNSDWRRAAEAWLKRRNAI